MKTYWLNDDPASDMDASFDKIPGLLEHIEKLIQKTDFSGGKSITLEIGTLEMTQEEFNALPDMED